MTPVGGAESPHEPLPCFLADTWWYGLTARMPADVFREAARLRRRQGFTALQLVVGIPPEVGPSSPHAASDVGLPWTPAGEINAAYLGLARERVAWLRDLGLRVIVYGAWGHQLRWLGVRRMSAWWRRVIEALDDLRPIWCLTGELDLWVGRERLLHPDGSTSHPPRRRWNVPARWRPALDRAHRRLGLGRRRAGWTRVLEAVAPLSRQPWLVHPTAWLTGFDAVERPDLLAANTLQTGHDEVTREALWQDPLRALARDPGGRGVINLEPWYEGIRDRFGPTDQLHAYWASMLAGARAHAYGAHGVWNVGDGRFLGHWGAQTLEQALALDTPRLLGASHALLLGFRERHGAVGRTEVEQRDGRLRSITWEAGAGRMVYTPDAAQLGERPRGRVWLPLEGRHADEPPAGRPLVFVSDG